MSKRDGIAKDENANRAGSFFQLVFARVAKPEAVDLHRHTGEPADVVRRQPLTEHRIADVEAWCASTLIPPPAHPALNRCHGDEDGNESGESSKSKRSQCS